MPFTLFTCVGEKGSIMPFSWAMRLIQLQLCLIYMNTAVLKCQGATWLGGTALHFVVTNAEVGRTQLAWLTAYPLAINVLTHTALFVEFAMHDLDRLGERRRG